MEPRDTRGLGAGLALLALTAALLIVYGGRGSGLPSDFVASSLEEVPTEAQSLLVLEGLPPGELQDLAELLAGQPLPEGSRPFLLPGLVYYLQHGQPTVKVAVLPGTRPDGEWRRHGPFLILGPPALSTPGVVPPIEPGPGGLARLQTPLGAVWASLDSDLGGSFQLQTPTPEWLGELDLSGGSVNLDTFTAIPADTPWAAAIDLRLLWQAANRVGAVEPLERWGVDLEKDLFPVLSGELGMALEESPPADPQLLRKMPVLLVAGLSKPGEAADLHDRLLPAPMRTTMPYTIHKGVTVRTAMQDTFGYALVANHLLVALQQGRALVSSALDAQLEGPSLAYRPDLARLRQELAKRGAHLALARSFPSGGFLVDLAAAGWLEPGGARGNFVVRLTRLTSDVPET